MSIITSICLNIDPLSVEDDVAVHALIRQQQSAMRVAYNRLADGWSEKDIYHQLKRLFPSLTGWEVNAALALARQTRASQAQILRQQASYLKTKIEKLRRKRYPKAHERADWLEARLAEIARHIEEGTIPPAIFGGRKLRQKVIRRIPGAREAWRDAPSKQYYSLGEAANPYGNRHCRLIETEEGTLRLQLRVGHGRWVEVSLHYSRQFDLLLRQVAGQGLKNTPRLMREGAAGNTGRW
jgi:hypothetical protein